MVYPKHRETFIIYYLQLSTNDYFRKKAPLNIFSKVLNTHLHYLLSGFKFPCECSYSKVFLVKIHPNIYESFDKNMRDGVWFSY